MRQNLKLVKSSLPAGNREAQKRVGKQLASDRWTVLLEFSIRADARRLFQALTVPEYIETWLTFPGHQRGCANVAATDQDNYVIKHRCEGKHSLCVAGKYFVCERHNLMFSWQVDGDPSSPETYVDIRLRGNFENTTLLLRHSGFESAMDCAWHRSLWSTSIGRLVGLYDMPTHEHEASKPRSRHRPLIAS